MTAPSVLPGRAFQGVDRVSDLLFHWRASDLSTTAVTGQAGTFARASSGGSVVTTGFDHATDPDDQLRLTGASPDGVPSWEYVLNENSVYVPALTLSGALTNLVTDDDLTAWSTATTTETATSDPMGGTDAWNLEDDNGATLEFVGDVVTFTSSAVKSAVAIIREGSAIPAGAGYQCALKFYDATAPATRGEIRITAWTDGEPTVTGNNGAVVLGTWPVGNGYWAIAGQSASVTHTNANHIQCWPGGAADVGSFDVYRVNVFDSPVPCPKILNASVAHAAETLYWDFDAVPQPMTVYYKGRERGSMLTLAAGNCFIGGPTGADDPRLSMHSDGVDTYTIYTDNGAANVSSNPNLSLSLGDVFEFAGQFYADGSVQAHALVNGATRFTGTKSAALAFDTSGWSQQRIWLGSRGTTGGQIGFNSHISLKVAAGVRSLAYMREAS